jgi:hypothetical protein
LATRRKESPKTRDNRGSPLRRKESPKASDIRGSPPRRKQSPKTRDNREGPKSGNKTSRSKSKSPTRRNENLKKYDSPRRTVDLDKHRARKSGSESPLGRKTESSRQERLKTKAESCFLFVICVG